MNGTELMSVFNDPFESHRKAMIRAAREKERIMEAAEKSLFVLERIHLDNLIKRQICTLIAVSEKENNLKDFFHRHCFFNIEFDENGTTQSVETEMGIATFRIRTIAFV